VSQINSLIPALAGDYDLYYRHFYSIFSFACDYTLLIRVVYCLFLPKLIGFERNSTADARDSDKFSLSGNCEKVDLTINHTLLLYILYIYTYQKHIILLMKITVYW
jgi:hypothetical protein